MICITVSKITGPERSCTSVHCIQTWWHAIASSTFFNSFILKTMTTLRTMTTQTTTDFGKYERFLTHWTTNFVNCTIRQNILLWTKWSCCTREKYSFGNIFQRNKRFGIKIYKFCNSLGYTYDMSVYLGKQRQHATTLITATHGTVLQLIRRVGPQNFHGQLFHLAWSVWWSVPTKNQCVWNSSPRQAWNATRY